MIFSPSEARAGAAASSFRNILRRFALVGRVVQILEVGGPTHRARIPVEVHPYTAGAFGGIVGAIAMAVLACLYGIFKYGSIWYPINLLAAAGVPELAQASLEALRQFSLSGLIVASIAHISISVLVGLLYAVLLPMLPARFEWLWGGIVTPLIWTALIFASLSVINPKLATAIDWPWFIFCQVAFGAGMRFRCFQICQSRDTTELVNCGEIGCRSATRDGG